jgi:hypothetical protein
MKYSAAKAFSFLLLIAMISLSFLSANAQGRYRGKFYSKADVDRIIRRVETRSDEFKKIIDRNLDRSVLDGTKREDNINEQVRELERALDNLRADFDRTDTWRETRKQVQAVLNQADEVNRIVRTFRFNRAVEAGWASMRADLNRLAGVYDLRLLR